MSTNRFLSPAACDLDGMDSTKVLLWSGEPRLGHHLGDPIPSIGTGVPAADWQHRYADMRLFLETSFVHAVWDPDTDAWRAVRWQHADLEVDSEDVQREARPVFLRSDLRRFGLGKLLPAGLPQFSTQRAQSNRLWLIEYRRAARPLTWRLSLQSPEERSR